MKTLLQRIQVWHSQREERWLRRWEKIRANGKPRFVFSIALTYTGLMILTRGIFEYFDDGNLMVVYVGRSLVELIIGTIAGFCGWSYRENEYKNALLKASPKKTLPLI